MTLQEFKIAIYQALQLNIQEKIEAANVAIESAQESRNSATKSSAGDKHETGRAMMQLELEQNQKRHQEALNLQEDLAKVAVNRQFDTAQPGALVKTNSAVFFIAIGHGKLMVNNQLVFAISLGSPVGQALHNKGSGDSFTFNGNTVMIESVY